jgi:hypothetical protein
VCKARIEDGPGHLMVDSPPWVHSVRYTHLTASAIAFAHIQVQESVETVACWGASEPTLDNAWCICRLLL